MIKKLLHMTTLYAIFRFAAIILSRVDYHMLLIHFNFLINFVQFKIIFLVLHISDFQSFLLKLFK